MKWIQLLWGCGMLAIAIGGVWISIERGRSLFGAFRHITRQDQPIRFWLGIAYIGAFCCAIIAMTIHNFIIASTIDP